MFWLRANWDFAPNSGNSASLLGSFFNNNWQVRLTGGKKNILVTQKKYYLLVINWQEFIWSYQLAFDNKTGVDHLKIEET